MTTEGDLVLVHIENQPAFFARIESIFADVKPQWFQVKMLVLQVPLVVITWILREPYINGEEFTMGGRPVRMDKVFAPQEEAETEQPAPPEVEGELLTAPDLAEGAGEKDQGKVISLRDRRKKPAKPKA